MSDPKWGQFNQNILVRGTAWAPRCFRGCQRPERIAMAPKVPCGCNSEGEGAGWGQGGETGNVGKAQLIIHAKEFGLCPGGPGSLRGVLTGKQHEQFGVQGTFVIGQKVIGRSIIPNLDVPGPMPPVSTGSVSSPKNRHRNSFSDGGFFYAIFRGEDRSRSASGSPKS